MIEQGIKDGKINQDTIIIELTSGNPESDLHLWQPQRGFT